MMEFNPRSLAKGTPVLVKTGWGWIDGEFYDYLPYPDRVRVRIDKIQRGKRRLLPPGATSIWPYTGVYGVLVEPSVNYIRPTDRRS